MRPKGAVTKTIAGREVETEKMFFSGIASCYSQVYRLTGDDQWPDDTEVIVAISLASQSHQQGWIPQGLTVSWL